MKTRKWFLQACFALAVTLFPFAVYAQDIVSRGTETARRTGVSAIWMLANISYAGMRAQGSPSTFWRIIAFIFGFPGTLLTLIVVTEGGERAYGIELPKRRD